jgi:hypothetical protein
MARIRTIKPEFPHSESMGKVSRDARLTFIQLWTLADDSGRLRGNSRMLASLLFPYDDDAPSLIETWLGELEREHCIIRYSVDDTSCLQVCNWLKHQKIDKPSPSKLPEFAESSRMLAKPLERSSEDQGSGSRTKEGNGSRNGSPTAQRTAPAAPIEFLDLTSIYPRRAGDQGWRKALRAAHARLGEGHTWTEILEGTRRYAAFVRSTGNEGTAYVKQAATFLGPDLFFTQLWEPPKTKAENQRDANIDASREWLNASH